MNPYACDHFVTPEHRIGDLETSLLGELVDSPIQVAVHPLRAKSGIIFLIEFINSVFL